MRSIEALRLLALAALASWVGGLMVLGFVVAPELFATLQQHDPAAGRELAALTFGEIFKQFQVLALVAGGLTLLSLGLRAAIGPRPRRMAIRIWVMVAMVVATVTTRFLIAPAIDRIREETDGPVASLPVDSSSRVLFGRLHGASTGLMLLTLVGGVWLIGIEARDRH